MQALGMIETKGLLASVIAADTMLKSAQVSLAAKHKTGGGLVAVIVTGDVATVKAAVEAAKAAIEPFDCMVSSHVIARPIGGLEPIVGTALCAPEKTEQIESQPAVTKEKQLTGESWDRGYLEGLKVIELRKLVREQKDPDVTGKQIRDGKKDELIKLLMRSRKE